MPRKQTAEIIAPGIFLTALILAFGCGKSSIENSSQPAVTDDIATHMAEAMDNWQAVTGITNISDIQNFDSGKKQPNAADAHQRLFREVENLDNATKSFLNQDRLTVSLDELERGLGRYHGLIEDIREASQIVHCQWYSDLQRTAFEYEHVRYTYWAYQLLLMEAVYQLRRGEVEQTLEFVEAVYRLADQIRMDPVVFCFVSGLILDAGATKVMVEVLGTHDVNTRSLQNRIKEQNYSAGLARVAAVEYAAVIANIKKKYGLTPETALVASDFPEDIAKQIIKLLEDSQAFIIDVQKPVHLQEAHSAPAIPAGWPTKDEDIAEMLNKVRKTSVRENVRGVMLLFALELRRLHNENGSYPNPDEIKIPTDSSDGHPISYEVLPAGGFIIRSSALFDIGEVPTKLEIQWD